jgi:hypothetical protein
MYDEVDLGSAPAEEDCAMVGEENYGIRAREECRRYIELLRATFGIEPPGAFLKLKSNPHDFGAYYSVVCRFTEAGAEYAYRLEDEAPARWS